MENDQATQNKKGIQRDNQISEDELMTDRKMIIINKEKSLTNLRKNYEDEDVENDMVLLQAKRNKEVYDLRARVKSKR